ncbi:protein FAM50A-like [Temnothorax curvispinosus]|uniref:Protein FAM50A-like n=1 Tax=Temnothorax curvispinosus TaxID=300111 RepID=A0A6J1PVV8_9HYME|nr:protein FAM50A-like [Temnothorax curvispinosus]
MFFASRERDEEENKLREELRQEWARKQNASKEEEIEITFNYWDGSGPSSECYNEERFFRDVEKF